MVENYYTLPKEKPLSIWTKAALLFCTTYTVVESPIAIHYKILNHKIYVVGEERLDVTGKK